MKIDLTPDEAKNVQVALMGFSKQPNVSRQEMIVLMNLMVKFDEQPLKEKKGKESSKDQTVQV